MSTPVDAGYGAARSAPMDFLHDPPDPATTQGSGHDPTVQSTAPQQSVLGPWASGPGALARAFGPTTPDPKAAAARVMDTGVEWGTDDYDARLVALKDELGKGDASYRAELMKEIFKKDPNALSSWLSPERANDLQQSGRISHDDKARLAEALAGAYNKGAIPQYDVGVGMTPGTGEDGGVSFNALDNAVFGADGDQAAIERAQRMREFTDFFESSSGPEVTQFREKYSRHLIDEYVLDPASSYHNPMTRDAAASLAGNLAGGDLGRPEIATNVLSKYSDDQVKTIIESGARADGRYGLEAMKSPARDRQIDPREVMVPDGAQQFMLGVGQTHNADADKIALNFARMATSAPHVYEGELGKDRVDALTLAVASHKEAVLGALTQYDNTYIGNEDNPNLQQYMQNASELGTLFKLTLFNPDSSYSKTLQDEVTAYAGDLATSINRPGPNGDDVGKMAMLQAGLTDGVRQGFEQLAKDEARQKEALSFVIDLAASAVPLGKLTTDGLTKVMTDAFGTSPRLQEALKAPIEQLVDQGTGKLTDAGKQALLDSLDTPHKNLEIARGAANNLNETYMKQISEGDYDRKQVDTDYKLILVGISTIRGK